MKMIKLILKFYLTLAIPLSYGLGLAIIWRSWDQTLLFPPAALGGIILSATGLLLWFLSYWSLGGSFGVLPQEKQAVKRGVYRWWRHPMYLGILATILGLSIATNSWAGVFYWLTFLVPLLWLRARREERLLRQPPR